MIRFTRHAEEAMAVREIAYDWIDAAISAPDKVEPDPRDPVCTRSYKSIAVLNGRVLRVVHRPDGDDILVITVHLDRRAQR